jgi:phage baseplate assembly protein V
MSQVNGVVVGLITAVRADGRVKVHFPWLAPEHETDWVRVATMMAGKDRGSFFMPEVDDEVLVAFQHGAAESAFVIGCLWNGVDKPPGKHVRERVFKSKNGHSVRFLDTEPVNGAKGAIVIEDAHRNRITLSNGQVSIRSRNVVVIEGSSIVFKVNGALRVMTPNSNPI